MKDNIDSLLIICVIFIMSVQMAASLLVFAKTIYFKIKLRKNQVKIETVTKIQAESTKLYIE